MFSELFDATKTRMQLTSCWCMCDSLGTDSVDDETRVLQKNVGEGERERDMLQGH